MEMLDLKQMKRNPFGTWSILTRMKKWAIFITLSRVNVHSVVLKTLRHYPWYCPSWEAKVHRPCWRIPTSAWSLRNARMPQLRNDFISKIFGSSVTIDWRILTITIISKPWRWVMNPPTQRGKARRSVERINRWCSFRARIEWNKQEGHCGIKNVFEAPYRRMSRHYSRCSSGEVGALEYSLSLLLFTYPQIHLSIYVRSHVVNHVKDNTKQASLRESKQWANAFFSSFVEFFNRDDKVEYARCQRRLFLLWCNSSYNFFFPSAARATIVWF